MPPYRAIDNEYVLLMLGVGLLVALAVILARGSRTFSLGRRQRSDEEHERDVHEFGGGVSETNRPVPLLIWLVFVGYFVWAAGYIVYAGRQGL
jgi:hypothetical protein